MAQHFQVKLRDWTNYEKQEDGILKRAYMAGFPNAKFSLRGQHYQYDFRRMKQINMDSGKERDIRAPRNMKPPSKPIVPPGPTTVVTVPPGGPGTTISIPHPKMPGSFISVAVPPTAKVGQAMLVPVPSDVIPAAGAYVPGGPAPGVNPSAGGGGGGGGGGGWSTGAKVAGAGAAVVGVGGLAVAGAVLGDHVATHGVDATGAMLADGAGDLGDGIADLAGDAGDGIADFAGDAGDWLLDAGDDAGDFIMDLF